MVVTIVTHKYKHAETYTNCIGSFIENFLNFVEQIRSIMEKQKFWKHSETFRKLNSSLTFLIFLLLFKWTPSNLCYETKNVTLKGIELKLELTARETYKFGYYFQLL